MTRIVFLLIALLALSGLVLFYINPIESNEVVADYTFPEVIDVVRQGDWGQSTWESLNWSAENASDFHKRILGEWVTFCPSAEREKIGCPVRPGLLNFMSDGTVLQIRLLENGDYELDGGNTQILAADESNSIGALRCERRKFEGLLGDTDYVIYLETPNLMIWARVDRMYDSEQFPMYRRVRDGEQIDLENYDVHGWPVGDGEET